MKTWKKILTIMIMLLVSSMTFFACGDKDPYADMKIVVVETTGLSENNVFTLSNDLQDNTFTVVATVDGVDDDVSKKITATSSNNGLVSIKSVNTEGDYTTVTCGFNVTAGNDVVSDGATIILTSEEGNQTLNFDVSIVIPLQVMSVNLEQIFISKGQVVSLENYPNLVSYIPSNTTQKGFSTFATPITSVDFSASVISPVNEYMQNNPGKIYIEEDLTINSFYLEIKSNNISSLTGEYETRKVLVVVLDKMDASAFGIEWTGVTDEDSLVLFDDETRTLTLVINSDDNYDYYDYHQADLQLTFNGEPLSSKINQYTITNIDGELETVEYRMYSAHIKNLSSNGYIAQLNNEGKLVFYKSSNLGVQDELFVDNNLISATKLIDDSQFKISQRGKTGEYTLTFIIDYYNCQGLYQPLTIDVKVITAALPSEIKIFSSKFDIDNATNEDAGYGDNDIVIYNNGNGTEISVVVWGNGGVIDNQPVKLEVDSANVSIFKESLDVTNSVIVGGDILTIKKSGELSGDVSLTLTSVYFPNITKKIVLKYVNENTSISFANTNVELDPEAFNSDPTTRNKKVALFTNPDAIFIIASGLPTVEDSEEVDYTTLSFSLENGKFNSDGSVENNYLKIEYDDLAKDWVMSVKNLIGSTRIFVETANGIKAHADLMIYYPIENPEFFKVQLVNFENYRDAQYNAESGEFDYEYSFDPSNDVYHYAGVTDEGEELEGKVYHTKLLLGETYDFYYMLGNQRYDSLSGIMTINTPISSNHSCVSVAGTKIFVNRYTADKVNLTLSFVTSVNNIKITIPIEITIERIVESVNANSSTHTIYDMETLDKAFVKNANNQSYRDLYGKANIVLTVNPANATTEKEVSWRVGNGNGITYIGDKRIEQDKEIYVYQVLGGFATITLEVNRDNPLNAVVYFNQLNDYSNFDFVVSADIKQTFVTAQGERVKPSIPVDVDIHVVKAGKVDAIVLGLYNNSHTFDIRDMGVSNGAYVSGNSVEFEYELVAENSNFNVVNKDIQFYIPNTDLNVELTENDTIKVTYYKSTGQYISRPYYTFYIVSSNGTKKDTSSLSIDVADVYANISTYYDTYVPVTIKVANGITIPFEIDTAEELMMIGNDEESMSANYVLSKNIYLSDTVWSPLGERENVDLQLSGVDRKYIAFTGSLSGRYELREGVYRDYGIYGMNLRVDNSGSSIASNISDVCYGLFGYIGETGVVENLKLYNFAVVVSSYASSLTSSAQLKEHIGAIAGYNKGKIINCEIDDGVLNNSINSATINSYKSVATSNNYKQAKNGIIYVAYDSEQLTTIANIGGVAGYNTGIIENTNVRSFISTIAKNDKKTVRTGGVTGINTGMICKDSSTVGENNLFVASSGLKGFDIAVVINAESESNNINNNAIFGGVVAINAKQAIIDGLSVRSYIFGKDNVGGLAGVNSATISNNVVIPTIIAKNNVGGLVGIASNGSSSVSDEFGLGDNIIYSNKVQFLDFKDEYSYFNTSIYARNNVGGLIGKYSTSKSLYSKDEKSINFSSVLGYNSVVTYYNRNGIDNQYSRSNNSGLYYGDIVIENDANNQYVSGYVGYADNMMISSGYTNTNVVVTAHNKLYYGGVAGYAEGLVTVFNTSILGKLNNIHTSNKVNAGYFFGYADYINTYMESDERRFIIDIATNQVEDEIGEFYHSFTNINDIKQPQKSLNEFDISDYYDIKIYDNSYKKVSFGFSNIVYSYSLVEVFDNNVAREDIDYASSGTQRKLYSALTTTGGDPAYISFKYDDGTGEKLYYLDVTREYIEITNIFAFNSFYLGQVINNWTVDIQIENTVSLTNESYSVSQTGEIIVGNTTDSLIYNIGSLTTIAIDSVNVPNVNYYVSLYANKLASTEGDYNIVTWMNYTNNITLSTKFNFKEYESGNTLSGLVVALDSALDVNPMDLNSNNPFINVYNTLAITDTGFNVGDDTTNSIYLKYFNKSGNFPSVCA